MFACDCPDRMESVYAAQGRVCVSVVNLIICLAWGHSGSVSTVNSLCICGIVVQVCLQMGPSGFLYAWCYVCIDYFTSVDNIQVCKAEPPVPALSAA